MKQEYIRKASDCLWELWKEQGSINSLPRPLKPTNKAQGYAIQACIENRSSSPIAGWKIAATSSVGQSHIGVSGPIAGRLLEERIHINASKLSIGRSLMKVAEAEFCFRMATDLPPKQHPYTAQEVLDAVSHLHPAIEIPDSRFKKFSDAGEAQLIADNACAHEFILGAPSADSWRAIDLKKHPVQLKTSEPRVERGSGANVLGSPITALAWLVNELCQFGMYVRKNQIVTTGTTTLPIPIDRGMDVFADFGVLGSTSVSFAK